MRRSASDALSGGSDFEAPFLSASKSRFPSASSRVLLSTSQFRPLFFLLASEQLQAHLSMKLAAFEPKQSQACSVQTAWVGGEELTDVWKQTH